MIELCCCRPTEDGRTYVLANGVDGLRAMIINMDMDTFIAKWNTYVSGVSEKSVFSELTHEERGFIATGTVAGITPERYDRPKTHQDKGVKNE